MIPKFYNIFELICEWNTLSVAVFEIKGQKETARSNTLQELYECLTFSRLQFYNHYL